MQIEVLKALEIFGKGSSRLAHEVYRADNIQELLPSFLDSHSRGQIFSKIKIVELILNHKLKLDQVLFVAHWHGLLPFWLFEMGLLKSGVGIELNQQWSDISRNVNAKFNWKSIHGDATNKETWDDSLLSSSSNDLVINTACEHMSYDWINFVQPGQMVLAQSNDLEIAEHTNREVSEGEFAKNLNLSEIVHSNVLEFEFYKRFTILGRK